MDHLVESRWRLLYSLHLLLWHLFTLLDEEACEHFARIVKAGCLRPIELYDALLLLILPNASGPVSRTRKKRRINRVQIYMRNGIGVAQEGAEYVVVVQGPVHDSMLLCPPTNTKNAFIVVREAHKVHSIIAIVVSVYFPKIRS